MGSRPRSDTAGSSPLARGLLALEQACDPVKRIIPACAGFTCFMLLWQSGDRDHPRLRGVYPHELVSFSHLPGSSPLARGLLWLLYIMVLMPGIIPACAGFTEE